LKAQPFVIPETLIDWERHGQTVTLWTASDALKKTLKRLGYRGYLRSQLRPRRWRPKESLQEAAEAMGEPASTFRRRPEYLKALISRPGERRRRYSRAQLERIKTDRLEANAVRAGQ
jgi:hypothetical protein